MRETVRDYERRTGRAYDPARWLAGLGRPLASSEACPTLFRYPGPCGLRDALAGPMITLGAPDLPVVWLAAAPLHRDGTGAARFGTLAVLEPLTVEPCPAPDHPTGAASSADEGAVEAASVPAVIPAYVAANQPLRAPEVVVWVPPSQIRSPRDWDTILTPEEAIRGFGSGYLDERASVEDLLHAYLEELSALRASGLTGPAIPWHEVPDERRRRYLAEAGLHGRYTSGKPAT
jgi:hypothetical protein